LLACVTKAPRKSLVDWIVQVLAGAAETSPAAGTRNVGERLEPVRRTRGRKRRENPPAPQKDDPQRREP